ncbi:tryptophan synthase subunit alpha [Calidifontibacillus oryziterrae]|uniref:tryptophan synthase subunit alpha n=1 Tax=Calidifontibacillus oryziterrae TaxID=1191699 RepID=UPI0002FEC2C8|nr:tryptophan synthase subunit alpha [Calidifontibacillus oryziterrae]
MTTFTERLPKTDVLFIPFIMAGDPNEEMTIEIALALQEAGAHVLELGIPYSDPLADGPVIQRAALRALKEKMTLKKAMALVPKMRAKGLKIPVVVFTYYNPVLQLGIESFFALAKENDIDGLLIPDIPFEESEYIRKRSVEEGIEFISLVAPTSNERIEKIAKHASGFLYCVSTLGVTGMRSNLNNNIVPFLKKVKEVSAIPVAVGFGISSSEQVQALKDHCDGVIVGSAIVNKIEQLRDQLLSEIDPVRSKALNDLKDTVQSIFQIPKA